MVARAQGGLMRAAAPASQQTREAPWRPAEGTETRDAKICRLREPFGARRSQGVRLAGRDAVVLQTGAEIAGAAGRPRKSPP
jgi:hypothetical protein